MTVTGEGLRIELLEAAKGTFFESGSANPTPALRDLLKVLFGGAGKNPQHHLHRRPHRFDCLFKKRHYDNWDLSADRANEARRLMQAEGIHSEQISQVRGFADRRPRLSVRPEDPSNRRISLIVQYQVRANAEVALPTAVTNQIPPAAIVKP